MRRGARGRRVVVLIGVVHVLCVLGALAGYAWDPAMRRWPEWTVFGWPFLALGWWRVATWYRAGMDVWRDAALSAAEASQARYEAFLAEHAANPGVPWVCPDVHLHPGLPCDWVDDGTAAGVCVEAAAARYPREGWS